MDIEQHNANKSQSVNQNTDNRSRQVLAELVQILFYQPIHTILLGHAATVFITLVFLWDTIPITWLSVWVCLLLGQTMLWAGIVSNYRHRQPSPDKASQWILIFPIAGTVTGLSWGITAFWPGVLDSPTSMVFLSIMVLGITAAGLAVFAPYLRSFVMFAGFILLPYAVRFFMEESKLHLTLSVMFSLYLTVILISGYNMRQAVRKSINLRLENLDLVDDLKDKNTQAEQAKEVAIQADISKSKFLAAASHDLRQPLHALGLFVDALENRIQYPEVRSIVDNIRISTDALSDLLNSLLDISKLDAGVLEPKPTDFQLRPIMQRIQTDFSELASSKSLQLEVVDCDFVVNTDPSMLERILRNLVSNAIRYTQQGSVKLDCQLQDKLVVIEVHDTGIGIAGNQLENIFEEFYQVENPERDRRKGLGLGLAIVKRLSDLLDLELTVNSSPDRGSTFSVTVPYVKICEKSDTSVQQLSDNLQGIAVLVIDDEAMIRLGMRKVLQEWGCEVYESESIQQAVELVQAGHQIDIVLTDYRLRDNENGIDAIRQIHAIYKECIPAIILTGDTDPKRLREAKDSGFSLLHKPVSPAKLRSLMSFQLERARLNDASTELT